MTPSKPEDDPIPFIQVMAKEMELNVPDLTSDELQQVIDDMSGGNGALIMKLLELNNYLLIKRQVYEAMIATSKETYDRWQEMIEAASPDDPPMTNTVIPVEIDDFNESSICNCGCFSGGCARPEGCKCDENCPCGSIGRPTIDLTDICGLCGDTVTDWDKHFDTCRTFQF